MDDTLVVEVKKAIKDLGDIDSDETLRKLSEALANVMKRSIFAIF